MKQHIMKEDSFMIIVPEDESIIMDPERFMNGLRSKDNIKVTGTGFDEKVGIVAELTIDERPYTIRIAPTDLNIPSFVRLGHQFTDEELKRIDEVKHGLAVTMDFSGDPRVCFYDQLRIVDAMVPDKLAVLDCPSEKLLSGRWAAMAAGSSVMPAPRYLFTVQAVSGDSGEVWLHTHGLKRCGLYELEILYSDKENYSNHYHIIETMAYRMIESQEPVKPGDECFIAQLDKELYMVVTAVDWKEALKYFPKAELGTQKDREDEVHSEDTYVIMAYKSPKDKEKKKYTPVSFYNEYLMKNPMFLVSTAETARMRELARERIDYMVGALENPENTVLAKIGLVTDRRYWGNEEKGEQLEHIWFEVKSEKDGLLEAVLTQEPYYISGMKEGDKGTYPFSSVTDWLVFTKTGRIGPDDAYLL